MTFTMALHNAERVERQRQDIEAIEELRKLEIALDDLGIEEEEDLDVELEDIDQL